MRKIYAIALMLVMSIASLNTSHAQTVNFGGTTMNNDIIGWYDLYDMSFTSHNYGSARSMAMGNAFTTLGADMISASLNPAGIGMYVENDVSISPMMTFSKSRTANAENFYPANTPKYKQRFSDRSDRFGLASIGGAATAYKGTGALTNVNIAFVYNRIADFNHNTAFASIGNPGTESLANVFCTLANVDGLKTNSDGTMSFGNDPFYWGTVLAYKNGAINKDAEGWFIDRIDPNMAEVDQYSAVETRGSLGEYALSVGFNFRDVIYVGASLGIQSLNYKRTVYYGENYIYTDGTPSGADMPYQLTYMNYEQRTRISGTGFNFKIGVTARPVDWLRIGVAYHTPTYYGLTLRYGADMWSETYSAGSNPEDYDVPKDGYMYDNVGSPIWEDIGPNSWNFRSPSRLMMGVAVTLAKRIIISADYERSWYQSIRLTQSPLYGLNYTGYMKEFFKGSNTVRLGAEAYVLPFLPIRVGYIWNGSTLRNGYKDIVASHPMPTEQQYITAGFGIKFNRTVYMDFAYQYGTTKSSGYQTFYAIDEYSPDLDIESNVFTTKTKRHIAVITLGVRF